MIRKHGNRLMGQVLAHSAGQVLFTPIDALFADLKERCGLDVSLPPAPQDPDQSPVAPSAVPLSSGSVSRPAEPFKWMLKSTAATGVDHSEIRPLEPLSELASPSGTDNAHGQASSGPLHDSSSSLPSLTQSPKSPATTPDSQQSSRSSGGVDLSDEQVEIEKLSSESPQTVVANSAESEIPCLTLDEQSEEMDTISSGAFQFKPEFHFRITSKARTPTWPVYRGSKVTKARVWSGVFSAQNISRS